MNQKQALEAMVHILNEERRRPTTTYQKANAHPLLQMLSPAELHSQRQQRPRNVRENPTDYEITGQNYALLLKLYAQVDAELKENLVSVALQLVGRGGECRKRSSAQHVYPTYYDMVSDLPLIAEFCIRTGNTERLFRELGNIAAPTKAIVLMLMQIEETLALNWNLFRPEELTQMSGWLAPFRKTAFNFSVKTIRPRGVTGETKPNPYYRAGREKEGAQVLTIIDDLLQEREHALYFYTKGTIERIGPLDVEGDKQKIVDYVTALGLPETLRGALDEAEKLFRLGASGFQLKSCLGHIRSFLEVLHCEAAKTVALQNQDTVIEKWGPATAYLQKAGVISKQHESFAASLYTLISDTSVHPLTADFEYARLLRIVVIEYAVMFLAAVQRRVAPSAE